MVFKIFKSKKKKEQQHEPIVEQEAAHEPEVELTEEAIEPKIEVPVLEVTPEVIPQLAPEPEKKQKKGFFKRLRGGLTKTRQKLGGGLASLVLGAKKLDQTLIDQIETQLIAADVGISTSEKIIEKLTQSLKRKDLSQEGIIFDQLKAVMIDILDENQKQGSLDQVVQANHPCVVLMVGINGAGKTTSIAKIAHHYKQQGKKIILAAGDTFRAAAVEQLSVWGERNGVRVVKQPTGADSASVIFDALSAAKANETDLVLADTAGRLHTQGHLMKELEKIKKVMGKQNTDAPHETLLVVDATLGQNSLQQVKAFHEAVGLTGICITKLDGSAKGGIVFSIADQCQIPVRFIGVGEGMEDLQPFVPEDFVEALFDGAR
jgi:fused signal recognition particle receptor